MESESKNDKDVNGPEQKCSFCKKTKSSVEVLVAGPDVNICNQCVDVANEAISTHRRNNRFKHTHELLNWHFSTNNNEDIVTSSRLFPERVRADLQHAVNEIFEGTVTPIRFVGVHGGSQHESIKFPVLLEKSRYPKLVGPLQYEDVDIGETEPVRCLENGLWLCEDEESGVKYAVLLSRYSDFHSTRGINIEFAVSAGEQGSQLSRNFFRRLEVAVNEAKSYRGKVLSLDHHQWYSGVSSGITVHKLHDVTRDQIILPSETIKLLERNILEFAIKRQRIKEMNFSTKKGVLFYGPPGTGKTHTVHFLSHNLPEHTTLLITAEQIALIKEYFLLARLLQPSIVVIEDVDLIARDRTQMNSPCEEALLNTLLNEMDGLKEDADIFFILTTNRPEMLETALASRPGRIDQAIEFPLPNEAGRRKLIRLYSGNMTIHTELVRDVAKRTSGVSAAFIRELMRRACQFFMEDGEAKGVVTGHIDSALQEMLFSGGKLNVKLLGGNQLSEYIAKD